MKNLMSLFVLVGFSVSAFAGQMVDFTFGPQASEVLTTLLSREPVADYVTTENASKDEASARCIVQVFRPDRKEAPLSHPQNHFQCIKAGTTWTLTLGETKVEAWGNFASTKDFSFKGELAEAMYLLLKEAKKENLSPLMDDMQMCGPNDLCITSYELLTQANVVLGNGKIEYGRLLIGCNKYWEKGEAYRTFCNVLDSYQP